MQWQSAPSVIGTVTHSRKTHHLVELLEFIELHSGENDDNHVSYDVEMMSFLNDDDILRPGDEGSDMAGDIEQYCCNQSEDGEGKLSKKTRKKRKKLAFDSEDSLSEVQNNAKGNESASGNYDGKEVTQEDKTFRKQSGSGKERKLKQSSKGNKKRSNESRNKFDLNFNQLFADEESDDDFDVGLHATSVFYKPQPIDDSPTAPVPHEPENDSQSVHEDQDGVEPRNDLLNSPVPQATQNTSPTFQDEQANFEVDVSLEPILRVSSDQSTKTLRKSCESGEDKGGGNSDPDYDLANLLPVVTPKKAFLQSTRRNHFQMSSNGVVPTPPSLDSLANISSLSLDASPDDLEAEVNANSNLLFIQTENAECQRGSKRIIERVERVPGSDEDFELSDCLWESLDDDTEANTGGSKRHSRGCIGKRSSERTSGSSVNNDCDQDLHKEQQNKFQRKAGGKELGSGNSVFHQGDSLARFGDGVICVTPVNNHRDFDEDCDIGDPFVDCVMSDSSSTSLAVEEQLMNNDNLLSQSALCENVECRDYESQDLESSAPMPSLRTRLKAQISRVELSQNLVHQIEDTSENLGSQKMNHTLAKSFVKSCDTSAEGLEEKAASTTSMLNLSSAEMNALSLKSSNAVSSAKYASSPFSNLTESISKLNAFKHIPKEQNAEIGAQTSTLTTIQESCERIVKVTESYLPCNSKSTLELRHPENERVCSKGESTNMILTEESNTHATRNQVSGPLLANRGISRSYDGKTEHNRTLNNKIDETTLYCVNNSEVSSPKPKRSRLSMNTVPKRSTVENETFRNVDLNARNNIAFDSKKKVSDSFDDSDGDEISHSRHCVRNRCQNTPLSTRGPQSRTEISCSRISSKLKTQDGNVVAVMESEDEREEQEEDEETPIKLARRPNKRRRNALSSPCSPEVGKSKIKGTNHTHLNVKTMQVGSSSEDEFEMNRKGNVL